MITIELKKIKYLSVEAKDPPFAYGSTAFN
jgi:hypothetical protein